MSTKCKRNNTRSRNLMTRRILLRLKLLKHPYLASRSRRSTCGRYQSIGLTLRPPSEDELLERGDCGGGVVLGGPDVRAVEEPKPDLDRLLPAGHLLPARSPPAGRPTSSSQDPRSPGSEAHSSKEATKKKSTETREGEILTTNSCFRVG